MFNENLSLLHFDLSNQSLHKIFFFHESKEKRKGKSMKFRFSFGYQFIQHETRAVGEEH